MPQHHARGRLVDVLPAMTAGADKYLFYINLLHAKRRHALHQLVFLFEVHGNEAM